MGRCRRHPDRQTRNQCAKYGYFLCDECLACKDPDIHCKHRSSCLIDYLSKRKPGLEP